MSAHLTIGATCARASRSRRPSRTGDGGGGCRPSTWDHNVGARCGRASPPLTGDEDRRARPRRGDAAHEIVIRYRGGVSARDALSRIERPRLRHPRRVRSRCAPPRAAQCIAGRARSLGGEHAQRAAGSRCSKRSSRPSPAMRRSCDACWSGERVYDDVPPRADFPYTDVRRRRRRATGARAARTGSSTRSRCTSGRAEAGARCTETFWERCAPR